MAIPGSRIRVVLLGSLLLAPPLAAQATERLSVSSSGAQGFGMSLSPSMSADGRFVAFQSSSANLVAADTNGKVDIFLRDRQGGTTRRMSLSSSDEQADQDCVDPSMSADGRFLAFSSAATNLVPGDTNAAVDIFVRDRLAGTTERVSVDSGGIEANGSSSAPSISADGRYVAFCSHASNLAGDANGSIQDVFVRDRQAGTTEMVCVAAGGVAADSLSDSPSISADGRFVAFESLATNLLAGADLNADWDVFVRDRQAGTTELASVDSGELPGNALSIGASISADGRWVAFESQADNLVVGDLNGITDLFVRDRLNGTTEIASLNSGQGQANHDSSAGSISADGRFLVFRSLAMNLVPGDTNVRYDFFVRDRQGLTTERVNLDPGGAQTNGDTLGSPISAAISADGRWAVFASAAVNLVPGDFNSTFDIFVRDRETTGFSSLCDPGSGGIVLACPCSNPPGGFTRGCNNSSSTGGAVLAASGVTHLSADSLVFTTSGEKPIALSIVLQGNVFLGGGVVYGQGVRCVGGSLKRLYARNAVGGSITVPDLGAGDLPVSAQSAAKGDPIQPGQPRWYTVYYRDPIVLGGCPSSSTFNATQTGQVSWSP
jgi:Tol biopolymer transport system component